jgi:Putative beta-barrel porin-2, OmpL-like. bbp2
MKRLFTTLGMVAAATVAFSLPAQADDVTVAQTAPAPKPSPTATPNPLQTSEFIDLGTQSGSARNDYFYTSPSIFGFKNADLQLHNLNLQATYSGTIGGKVELSIGEDAQIIHSYPQSFNDSSEPSDSSVDLTQAYVSYTQGPLSIIAGKFETLAGAEVIEATGNTNYSRSILFGYAIPFTHTGVRATYAVSPTFSAILGFNKGWDISRSLKTNSSGRPSQDDTNSLTTELGVAYNPTKSLSINAQLYDGQVENSTYQIVSPRNNRALLDVVASYKFSDTLTGILNYDTAHQTTAFLDNLTAKWNGLAGYLNDQITPKWLLSLRGEVFNDVDGYRLFFPGTSTTWHEATLTGTYSFNKNLSGRAELRSDSASDEIFEKPGYLSWGKTNTTFGLEAILKSN